MLDAVIWQHEDHEGPELIGPALTAAGFALRARLRAPEPADADAPLLVVLGGHMGVYEQAEHPYLTAELAVLRARLARDRPVLGICLGAQLLAAAAGAEVSRGGAGFEVGVGDVTWTADGQADPVTGGAPTATVAHWHGDTFTAVPGATLLASSPRYRQQAYRLGGSYGLQFHLELTAANLAHWLRTGEAELAAFGQSPSTLAAELPRLAAAEPANRALLARLAAHFPGRYSPTKTSDAMRHSPCSRRQRASYVPRIVSVRHPCCQRPVQRHTQHRPGHALHRGGLRRRGGAEVGDDGAGGQLAAGQRLREAVGAIRRGAAAGTLRPVRGRCPRARRHLGTRSVWLLHGAAAARRPVRRARGGRCAGPGCSRGQGRLRFL